MTLENAKVLHKHYLEIGREKHAKQLEERYPELNNLIKPNLGKQIKEIAKKVKEDGNDNTRRNKR